MIKFDWDKEGKANLSLAKASLATRMQIIALNSLEYLTDAPLFLVNLTQTCWILFYKSLGRKINLQGQPHRYDLC
jgi:hypothetical protein